MTAVLNGMIQAKEVRLIDENGDNVGVVTKTTALIKAEELGVDLVQLSQNEIPVCKLIDFKKFKYEQKKKLKENKDVKFKWKEVQLSLNIGEHDLNVKAVATNKFLDKGHKVKVILLLKGREIGNSKAGVTLMEKFKDLVGADVKVTKEAKLEGARLIMHLEN